MDGPVTLLLVVSLSGGEARLGQLRATLAAQLDPRQVQLSVRRADGVADLDAMLEAAAERGPVALVTNPARGRFELKVALQPGGWVRRSFRFAGGDPVRERNRTVALAIASMTPEWRRPEPLPEAEPEPEPEQPAVPRLGEPEPPSSADAGAPEAVDAGEPAPPLALEPSPDAGPPPMDAGSLAQPVPAPAPAPAAPRLSGVQIEVAAQGATWPLEAGGQLGAQYCGSTLCAGVAVRAGRAEVPAAAAEVIHGGAMVVVRAHRWIWGERLGLAVQAGLGPGWMRARRGSQTQERWQLDVDLAPEVWVRLVDPVSVFLRVGLGVGSGATPIFVNDVQVSELPAARAQLALGIRLGR